MVKLLNARKHRESEPSHTRLFKAGAKRQAVESGSSNVARRALTELPVSQSGPKSSRIECRTWKGCLSGPRRSWPPQPQGREAEPAWRRPKKPMPACNVTDMPTSARCRMAQNMWNRLQLGKANDERRPSLGASRSCRPMERNQNGRRPVLPSCPSRLPCLLRMPGNLSSSGSPRTRLALERLELCEAKVSCTVLRGVRAG